MQFITTLRKPYMFVTGMVFLASLLLTACGGGGSAAGGGTNPVILKSIAITPPSATVAIGQQTNFTATGTYSNGTTADITAQVTWASADTGIAAISNTTGIATGVALGSTTVTASLGGITSSATNVNVTAAVIIGLNVSPVTSSVIKGASVTYTATAAYSDGKTGNISGSATWASSDTAVATVNGSGIASALAQGSAAITASANGITSNIATLKVKQLASIAINPTSASVVQGLSTKFTAIGTYTDATTADITNQVSWKTANAAIATIDSTTGIATGIAAGSTTVKATMSGITSPNASLTVTSNSTIVSLTGIVISPASQSIPKGTSNVYTATGTYSDGSSANISGSVVWASSNTSVATINGTGVTASLAQGTTTITASSGSVTSNAATLIVAAPALTGISVNPGSASVPKWLTTSFTATGTYTDGSTANISGQVAWATGNSGIATINSTTGVATGVAIGNTTVTAAASGITSPAASLSVTAAVLTGISITPSTQSTPKGTTVIFTATGTYSDGSTADASGSVNWASSDITIATINGSGVLTTLKKGSTLVTASASGLASNSVAMTVTDAALIAISINPGSATIAKGLSASFTATGTYTDATTASIPNAEWATADGSIASINSSSGLATGISEGSTTVTASAGGITSPAASLSVTAASLTGISITPIVQSIPKGTPVTFTAIGGYSDGSSGDVSGSVSWASSNATVATLNSTGIASTKAQGSTTVTATASGITSNSAALTVTAPVLAQLSITPVSGSITLGNTLQFQASGKLTDGTVATLGTINWASSNAGVATIGGSGLVTAQASGSCNISAVSGGLTSNTAELIVSLAASGGVSAVAASGQLTISWTPVAGAVSYNLYWGTESGLAAPYTKVAGVTSPYILAPLVDGTTYYYRIGAVAADGSEIISTEAFSFLYVGGAPAGTFTATTNQLAYARVGHTSTLLSNGKVIVAGGEGTVANTLAYSELYDPVTASFTATGNLNTARAYATDTLLPNGKALVVGGHNSNGANYLASAELYNPGMGIFEPTGSMAMARDTHTATLLADGKVLITGGWNGTSVLNTAEIYDPATGKFTSTGSMLDARHSHTATLLASGKVLVTGGCNIDNCSAGGNLKTAELYDPATGSFTATGTMLHTRFSHTATLIAGGKVFIIGGKSFDNSGSIAISETYNPDLGVFVQTATMTDAPGVDSTGFYRSALLLSSGDVLIMPCGCGTNPTGAHLYDTATDTFSLTGSSNGLHNQNSDLLFNGKVLLTGGQSINNGIATPSNDAELFN